MIIKTFISLQALFCLLILELGATCPTFIEENTQFSGTYSPGDYVDLTWDTDGCADLLYSFWRLDSNTPYFITGFFIPSSPNVYMYQLPLVDDQQGEPLESANYFFRVSAYLCGETPIYSDTFYIEAATLPIEMESFYVQIEDREIKLNWNTTLEINNKGFEIQHSRDSKTWDNIGFVEGQGTSLEYHDYYFIHNTPHFGYNYYRLKQVDYNGQTSYSDIQAISFNHQQISYKIYPNPAHDFLIMEGNKLSGKKYHIINMSGKSIQSGTILNNTIVIDKIRPGIHLLKIINANDNRIYQFIKQ